MTTVVFPYDSLNSLPVTFICSRLVCKFWQIERLSIVCMKMTHECVFWNILQWNTENEIVRTLTIEVLMVNELWFAFRIKKFDTVNELKVRAIYRNQVTAISLFARLFRESCYLGTTNSHGLRGLCLFTAITYNNLSTFSRDTRWCIHSDHVVANNLKVTNLYTTRKFYFSDVIETRAINCHWLIGDNLRREEHLYAKPNIG